MPRYTGRTAGLSSGCTGSTVQINDQPLNEGDGLAIEEPDPLRLHDAIAAEILLFDMKA